MFLTNTYFDILLFFFRYGEGPYVVRFFVHFPTGKVEPNMFDIKIYLLEDMAHTVWTFLNLIENGLYIDTMIESATSEAIKLGNPTSITHSQLQTKVNRRYEQAGFSTDNTLFTDTESSVDATCRQYSFGLNHRYVCLCKREKNCCFTLCFANNPVFLYG